MTLETCLQELLDQFDHREATEEEAFDGIS